MELPNDIVGLQELVIKLLKRIEELEAENAELKRRLKLNSHNSHKPPSSEGLQKKPALPKERKGKKHLRCPQFLMRYLSFRQKYVAAEHP